MGRHPQPARRSVVLDRQSGLGIPGDRAFLADTAYGRPTVLVLAGVPRGATSQGESRPEAVRHLFPDRRVRNPVLLPASLLLRRQDALLHRGRLALLAHPSLGRGFLRIFHHGYRRRDFLSDGHSQAPNVAARDLSRCHPLFRRGAGRYGAPLVLHRPDAARDGARRDDLGARSGAAHPAYARRLGLLPGDAARGRAGSPAPLDLFS